MKTTFSHSDIEEFLAEHDYGLWTSNFYDLKSNKLRQAKKSDLEENNKFTLEIIDSSDEKILKDFAISDFKFSALSYSNGKQKIEKDLTMEWCSQLLDTYDEEYATALISHCDENIKVLEKANNTKSNKITDGMRNKIAKLHAFYTKLKTKAKTKMQEKSNTLSA